MKNLLLSLIGLLFIALCFYAFLNQPAPDRYQPQLNYEENKQIYLFIGNNEVQADLSDTPELRENGLSGEESLGNDRAMLFVFDSPNFYGIWMKDMNFPIDIAWLSEDKRIVTIKKDISPDTYPTVFYPDEASMYVIELPAGYFDSHSVDIGEIVSW